MKIPIDKFESWLRNKNLKERTIEEYIYYFSKFKDSLFSQETVSRFLSIKSNRNAAARSFLANLRKFIIQNYKELGFSIEDRLEASEVELPKISGRKKQRIIKTLTFDEIKEIEKHLEKEKNKLKLLCSYYAGLRVGELLKIKVISFNWNEWKKDPTQMGECRVLGKGDKEGLAFFPSNLMIRIARYIKSQKNLDLNSTIFIKRYQNHRTIKATSTYWAKTFREACIKAKIIKVDSKGKIIDETRVTPHCLRHSYATHLEKRGVRMKRLQNLMRHSSITSTELYTHVSKEDLKKEASKI